jgi:hypothetical protein
MDPDQFPLSVFEVDCDGSACGSGPAAGPHVHPPQYSGRAWARVVVRNHVRVSYGPAAGITRLTLPAGQQ